MKKRVIDRKLGAVWSRFNNTNQMASISLDEIREFAVSKGLVVNSIKEIKFGFSPSIKGVLLETDTGKALYPRQRLDDIDTYNKNIKSNKNYEEFWRSVDWFAPPYISMGKIHDSIEQAGLNILNHHHMDKKILQEQFEYSLTSLYDFGNIIPITAQVLPESKVINKHLPVITESIFAFYSGMRVAAIAALIPIIEDILTSIIGNGGTDLDLISKVNKSIDLACERVIQWHIEGADWIPDEYIEIPVLKIMNERIFVLETMRHWLINSFYVKTDDYDKISGFNRHFFAHAKSDVWQNQSNFFRAMGLIQALAFIECFAVEGSKVGIFAPEPDERTESLRQEIFACMNLQVFKKVILAAMQTKNNLPFNPTASDDGWLLRAAILSDKMNTEVIVRLRDKAWQCHSFIDPVKEGEYITINAKKDDRNIKIALLYSCASDNSLYRELDKSCDYILYHGNYYKQDSYAGGIKAIICTSSDLI